MPYKKGGHETEFVPAKAMTHAKKETEAAFVYKENPPPKRPDMRDKETKEVITQPPNVLTNPIKSGKTHGRKFPVFLGGNIEWMPDFYDAKKKIRIRE